MRAADVAPGRRVEAATQSLVPERIELGDRGRQLRLCWPDGLEKALSAMTLRNACRCAACTHLRRCGGHLQMDTDTQISMRQVTEFGVAGLQLVFSDGHRRGIFPWGYLRQLTASAG